MLTAIDMEENSIVLRETNSDLSSSSLNTASSRIQDLLRRSCTEKYTKLCQQHLVPANIQQNGYHYLKELIGQDILDTDSKNAEAELFASVTYIALIDARLPYGPLDPHLEHGSLEPAGFTVSDVLLMNDVNINRLFETMKVLDERLSVSKSVQAHLTQLKRNYLVVSALFHAFQTRLCPSVFRDENSCEGMDEAFPLPIPESEGVPFRKKQCWILFLLAKYNLLPDRQELFQHFQLLLCCLEFVLRQAPSFLLNTAYAAIRFSCFSSDQGIPMLKKLAEDFEVSVEETLHLRLDNTEAYFQTLLNKDAELDSDSLCEEYKKIYVKDGDVDEMLYLCGDSHLLPLMDNRISSQLNGHSKLQPEQMTPVRVAISTIQLLNETYGQLKEESSEKLNSYFQRCSQSPVENVRNIISDLKEKFIQKYQSQAVPHSQQKVAEQRFSLGLKLYFKVLEAMMDSDVDRLSEQVLNTLLNNENFHKSLLACALEVVLTTYGQNWNYTSHELTPGGATFSFPWILEVFSLQAYEFYKVVESFIKAEPNLTADIVKHLRSVELRILDSLAWHEKSSLFDILGDWDFGQMTPPIPASPIKFPEGVNGSPRNLGGSSRCAVDLFSSPVRQFQSSAPVIAATTMPVSQISSGDILATDSRIIAPQRSQSLTHFLRRVCHLGCSRLLKLCSYLEICKDLQNKIWTCFEHCITKMPALLRNRHIDQIIMCCIYGVCKVAEQEVLFKSIVSVYKTLPNARQEVCKDVYITRDRQGSIISFYNHVFMNAIKSFILQFAPSRNARPQLSPMPKQSLASPGLYSLPGKKNFIVSPLRESPFKAPASPSLMTPRSRLLYNFGETSSEKLKEFNETMSARVGLASAKKRLNMDDMQLQAGSKVRRTF